MRMNKFHSISCCLFSLCYLSEDKHKLCFCLSHHNQICNRHWDVLSQTEYKIHSEMNSASELYKAERRLTKKLSFDLNLLAHIQKKEKNSDNIKKEREKKSFHVYKDMYY